jgi:hypothetical protein
MQIKLIFTQKNHLAIFSQKQLGQIKSNFAGVVLFQNPVQQVRSPSKMAAITENKQFVI